MSGPLYGLGRRDAAEPEVIAAFRSGGASVQQLSGRDVPDLLVGYLGVTRLVEVKTNRATLKPGQRRWAETWLGEAPCVARTAPQARKLLNVWAERGRPARPGRTRAPTETTQEGRGRGLTAV